MKKIKAFILSIILTISFTVCDNNPANDITGPENNGETKQYEEGHNITVEEAMTENKSGHGKSSDYEWDRNNIVEIILNDDSISAGEGVEINRTTVTITKGGDYYIKGNLSDGRLIVDNSDDETIRLVLDNVNINYSTNAPLSVVQSEKTIIILADDSDNYFSDGNEYVYDDPEEDEPNAAIFSKDDLSISGNGSITVTGNYNDGIAGKDGLIINSGTINVEAVDDGIRGKDYLIIQTCSLTINSGGDALKSDNDEDADRGYILIEDGHININSNDDGIDAETDLLIESGSITIKSGGGSGVAPGENSTKGVKANNWLIIDNGSIEVNSSDDAIHSNSRIVIGEGDYRISSGDDAIHADSSIVINNGEIDIISSVEGIEGQIVAINNGTIKVNSSDDCINSTSGSDVEHNDSSCTYLYGGYIVLSTSQGDGLDSNGSIVMTAGTLIIHGPSRDPEVMFDYNGTFNISGGLLIASGNYSRMTQAPSSSSSQNSLIAVFNSSKNTSTLFHLENSDGENIVTFQPAHQYQSVVFSSPELKKSEKFTVYLGGKFEGTNENGLYSEGTYSNGTEISSFTISKTITSISQ